MKRKTEISQTDAFALFSLSLILKEGCSIDAALHATLDGMNSGMAARLARLSADELSRLKAAISNAGQQGRMLGPFKADELFNRLAAMAGREATRRVDSAPHGDTPVGG